MSKGGAISQLMSILRACKPHQKVLMEHNEVNRIVVEAIKNDHEIFQLIVEKLENLSCDLTWTEIKAILCCTHWIQQIFGYNTYYHSFRSGAWDKIRVQVWLSLCKSPEVDFRYVHLAQISDLLVYFSGTHTKQAIHDLFEILDFINDRPHLPSFFDWQIVYSGNGYIDFDVIKKCLLQIDVYPEEGQKKLGLFIAGLKTEQQLYSFHEQMGVKKTDVIASILAV